MERTTKKVKNKEFADVDRDAMERVEGTSHRMSFKDMLMSKQTNEEVDSDEEGSDLGLDDDISLHGMMLRLIWTKCILTFAFQSRKFDNNESPKPKSRPKGNGGRDNDQGEKNGEGPRASQGKPWDRKGPLKCYLCQGQHRTSVCPKKVTFHAMKAHKKAEDDTKSLNSILGGVEENASNGLMFVDIIVAGRGLNAFVDTSASDLFMSEEKRNLGSKLKKI
ncbi:hypothetical protein GOBAR_AA20881 [Gossypium barbadense]|uniref:Uncharacterized protein n=1 Tax=Gossypium barbadense TaxID=3634 RepID=A0A2P5X8V2_GOSBA|nr:hypothetical protein GOBAR_AA20881 [Gossypium barbadense]